jgi:hypothetical protein
MMTNGQKNTVEIMDQDAWRAFAESFAEKWDAALGAYKRRLEEDNDDANA